MKDLCRRLLLLFWAVFIFTGRSYAQGPYSYPTTCQPNSGVTALPQCDFVSEKLSQCNTSLPLPQRRACYCTQEVFSALFNCKSEQRLCVENDNLDSAVDSIIDNWHIECDSFVSSEACSITTPVVTSLTATFDVLNCQSIAQSCLQALQASTVCSTKYTVGVDFNSCLCQSSILSLASVCEYDGNVSCKLTTANIQNVYGWGSCQGYQTILTTSMAQSVPATLTNPASQSNSATLSATAALSSSTASLTITQPPFMSGPSVTPGSVTSTQSTTSRSAAIKQQQVGDWGIFTIIIICLIFVFSSTFPQI